jgi:competence ComEA-like helix-hairpin-helix protein
LLDGGTIDLNRASAALLERLPGIGPARAAAIVRERERGEFASVADLERVSGIGPGIRRALEGWLMVSGHIPASASSHAAGRDPRDGREQRDG